MKASSKENSRTLKTMLIERPGADDEINVANTLANNAVVNTITTYKDRCSRKRSGRRPLIATHILFKCVAMFKTPSFALCARSAAQRLP